MCALLPFLVASLFDGFFSIFCVGFGVGRCVVVVAGRCVVDGGGGGGASAFDVAFAELLSTQHF